MLPKHDCLEMFMALSECLFFLSFTEPDQCTNTRFLLSANTEQTVRWRWGAIWWIRQNIYGISILHQHWIYAYMRIRKCGRHIRFWISICTFGHLAWALTILPKDLFHVWVRAIYTVDNNVIWWLIYQTFIRSTFLQQNSFFFPINIYKRPTDCQKLGWNFLKLIRFQLHVFPKSTELSFTFLC